MTEKKSWENIIAGRENFEGETKRENMLELIVDFYEIFMITDLEFTCTDEDVVRHYSLKSKWEHWFDTENF